MDHSLFEFPDWHKALTLTERGLCDVPAGDEAFAERRLARWRGQEPFAGDGLFARRLALDGLTERELRALLGEPADALASRETVPLPWLTTLIEAFTRPAAERFPQGSPGFLGSLQPILDTAWSRLLEGIRSLEERYPAAPFDAATAGPLLAANLPRAVLPVVSRTMVAELQIVRHEGRLAGETPEERYQSFLDGLREPAQVLAILRQYPVLARALVETADRWVLVSLELLERLASDAPRLAALFSDGVEPGPLVELRTGLGDPHRGNRTVALFRFASGLRLVYKPKSLAVEAAFQRLLDWTVRKGFSPAFRTLHVLDRGEYGWIEFVEAASCPDEEAVRRFYLRQGGSLALLWLFEATDFHRENLIAVGEHPVLVDLEALFDPQEPRQKTVLDTGLLPSRIWREGGGEGVDLSGLTGSGGQAATSVLQPERAGTDEMRFVLKTVEIPASDNLPTLDGEPVTVTRYTDEVVEGFHRMVRLFLEHRHELAAPGGPLDAFADVEVRVIVRPTRSYVLLLLESFHPFVLTDALDRDRLLDRLWLAVPEDPDLERLIPAERRDLLRGDIPIFTTRPGTRDVWSSDGERFPDLQPDTGLERVRRRLEQLDESETDRQAWLVHNSLAAIDIPRGRHPQYEFQEADPPSREELLAAAVEIGDRLAAIAFRAHWFAPQTVGATRHWSLQPAGLDLYDGIPGIALFLAFLGEVTAEARFVDLARAAVINLREGDQTLPDIGAFSGWGGPVWVLAHLGALWGDEELLREAERIAAEKIAPQIQEDENSDLIGGSAGALISLLTLHEVRPSDRLLETAAECGERLLARALPMKRGLGWHLSAAGPTPLAGLSHGAAGIAWPLLRLAALTGDDRFRDAALGGLMYERSLYRPDKRNWPDLRDGTAPEGAPEPHFMWAWCHGAPGIGLGRLASLPWLDEPAVRAEIESAVESTIENGFGRNHSLCHGDLGNLELVTLAAEKLGRPDWNERAGRIAGGILAGLAERGPLFGLPGSTEPPGMMTGLAGIGYGLLRLSVPRRVPSVLILEGLRFSS
ncbi:MAG TPA: type 2 lanthipeptide synthetase LanM family protein [Thermoanaerobaculia bacterium]|nr:type 2 lanthipeptide synthetase LanM family protein [Thermoanaerobaculia bacterium]